MRELIAVRMHRAEPLAIGLFDRLAAESGRAVVCCCDERLAAVEAGNRPKVAWNEDTLAALGLPAVPDAGWRCGDYAYYALRAARPGFDRYWLIEPDLLIHAARAGEVFDRFTGSDADLLALFFGPAAPDWHWRDLIGAQFARPFACFFPLTRLSAAAIDHLVSARRSLAAAVFRPEHWRDWPNDETFVATALSDAGFRCADFRDLAPDLYDETTIRHTGAHDRVALLATPPDGRVWHPVPATMPVIEAVVPFLGQAFLREGQLRLAEGRKAAALEPLLRARLGMSVRQKIRDAAGRLVAEHFGPARGAPPLAIAALVNSRPSAASLEVAGPADFRLSSDTVALRRIPPGRVLPYAFDLMARELLLTLHADPAPVLRAPFLYAGQREHAHIVLRVPFARLDDAFGPRDPAASPILVFSTGRTGSTLVDALLGCATPHSYSEPDTATQLGTLRARIAALPRPLQERLTWHALSPLLRASKAAQSGAPCAIKFRSQANAAMPDFLHVFPRARFVFMLRERRAWARSHFRAFAHAPVAVARRLAGGLRSLAAMRDSPVESYVVTYEELIAAPDRIVATLLGVAVLPEPVQARIAAVMAEDSQRGSAVAREATGRAAPGEDAWMAAFDDAWATIRPAGLIARLGLPAHLA